MPPTMYNRECLLCQQNTNYDTIVTLYPNPNFGIVISIDINPGHIGLFDIFLWVQVLIPWPKTVTTFKKKVIATLQGGGKFWS